MRHFVLLTCATLILAFSGCNQGEINLLKDQVAELKKDKDNLQKRLDEANAKLAKFETMKEGLGQQVGLLKKLMPNLEGLGDVMDVAKDLGLPELQDFNKEDMLKKAQEGLKQGLKSGLGKPSEK